jgi:hypothetical protein
MKVQLLGSLAIATALFAQAPSGAQLHGEVLNAMDAPGKCTAPMDAQHREGVNVMEIWPRSEPGRGDQIYLRSRINFYVALAVNPRGASGRKPCGATKTNLWLKNARLN